LTSLYALARRASESDRQQIEEVLGRCFPSTLKPYLFTPGGEVRSDVLDVSELQALIARHRAAVLRDVQRAFRESWPIEDSDAVSEERIATITDGMARALSEVLTRFKRRLGWARGELARLAREEAQKGVLDPEDQAHRRRCQRVIERLKGQAQRTRAQAQGGGDDSDTMGALAREGFLPGYGLESGSVIGTAEPPRMTQGLSEFDLPRAPTIALREYVPGNAIYANGFRFVPRRFQLSPDDTMRFRVDAGKQVVSELGVNDQAAALGSEELRAVPVCEVLLPSQVADLRRGRLPFSDAGCGLLARSAAPTAAAQRGAGRAEPARSTRGAAPHGERGAEGESATGRDGLPSASPADSRIPPMRRRRSKEEFQKKHLERCSHRVEPTGFFADVEVDVLGLHDAADRTDAFSLIEAIRMGAARVLDMEVEDLQITSIGHVGDDTIDVLLYDPMPGGSGLLEQLVLRWSEVSRGGHRLGRRLRRVPASGRASTACRLPQPHLPPAPRPPSREGPLERGPQALTELHPIRSGCRARRPPRSASDRHRAAPSGAI
jgi:hypothetical protein